MDLSTMPALEIARHVRNRDLSPVEVVEAFLSRVERINPQLNAYVALRPDAAREAARRLADRIARGEDPGPLAGVPFSIKDVTPTADLPTTFGSRAFEGNLTGADAVLVERMRAAGGLLVGKTNTSEFAARPTCENELFGTTRNPWNLAHTPGGSSGGAAAAVAAGISPLAQGGDDGGSIRIPASCCGVFGLKPSRGRVSLAPSPSLEWGGLGVAGPIARTVADAAAMLDVIAGPAPGDATWAPPPDRPFLDAVRERRRLRVAVWLERDGIPTDPRVRQAVVAVGKILERLGHVVDETQGPDVAALEEHFLVLSTVGIGSMDLPRERWHLIEERNRILFEAAHAALAVDLMRSMHEAERRSRAVVSFWDGYDVLVTPTLTAPAPEIGALGGSMETAWEEYRRWLAFTWPFNVTGQPAASVPAGFTGDGLPIGVQVVGRPADEHTVLSVAGQIEEALPWSDFLPPVW